MGDTVWAILDGAFQSTPPARGATMMGWFDKLGSLISIHAPREGGDPTVRCGGGGDYIFQSTPPARGATPILYRLGSFDDAISIHAPREGGDDGACNIAAH